MFTDDPVLSYMFESDPVLAVATFAAFLSAIVLRLSLGTWTTLSIWSGLSGSLGLLLFWLRLS